MSIYGLIQKNQKIRERLRRSISSKLNERLSKELHLISEIIKNTICNSKKTSNTEVQFTLEVLSRSIHFNDLSDRNEPRHQ